MTAKKVLILGASGVVGRAAIEQFAAQPGWDVVAVSRRTPADLPRGVEMVAADLTDRDSCARIFGAMADVSYVVFAALHEKPGLMPGWMDEQVIETNAAMLRNVFDPLLAAAAGLEGVTLLQGTKAYGLHHPEVNKAAIRIPLKEREPRTVHRNFYFLQEDYLREAQRSHPFALTIFRPTVIYGEATGNNMNPLPVIGAYGALLKEEGKPLYFPGRGDGIVIREAVDAALVARAVGWAAGNPAAAAGTFNLTNGDVFVWQSVWPAIAAALGMEVGEPRTISLTEELPKRQEEWQRIVAKHDLLAPQDVVEFVGYNSLIYTDMVMTAGARTTPFLNSTIAARLAGFHDCMDTEDMFVRLLRQLQEKRLLPRP